MTRFREVVDKLKMFLKHAGFRVSTILFFVICILFSLPLCNQDTNISYIPCSGLTGENLVHQPTDQLLLQWYHGSTLLDTIGKKHDLLLEKMFL